MNKKSLRNNKPLQFLLPFAVMMTMMMFASSAVWGQAGIWYIASSNNNSGDGYTPPVYSPDTPATNWYLVPARNPQQSNAIDAYYSPNHATENGDPNKPFLTTHYITKEDVNAIWLVVPSGEANYYHIIHAETGKYVIYEVPLPNDGNKRKTMHLQTPDDGDYSLSTNQNYKFKITANGTGYNIQPKNRSGWYWNTAGQNNSDYWGTKPSVYHIGLVGVYNNTGGNSVWYFEDASSSSAITPIISDVNGGTNTFSITSPAAIFSSFRYTTDGSTPPTASVGTLTDGSSIQLTGTWNVQAVGIFDPSYNNSSYITPVAGPKELIPVALPPNITYDNTTGHAAITSATASYICYTTGDGTQADPTISGTHYSSPVDVTVSGPTTIKAIAVYAGDIASTVATLAICQVATPTIQDNGSNAISITCATEGAIIYYTTNGNNPTTSSTEYTGPLTENVSGVTIKAIAVKENMINSEVGSGTVTLKCAAPVVHRDGAGFTITCATPGATIYYTYVAYPGTPADPTTSSSHITSGGTVSCTLPVVVKAFASASNYNNSDITTTNVLDILDGDGTSANPYLIPSPEYVDVFVEMVNTPAEASKYYKVTATSPLDFSSAAEITQPFSGNFDGGMQTLTGLSHALFNTVNGGTVKNVMLKGVAISSAADTVGAIANIAKGYTRIYNCGILPNNANFPAGTHPSVATSGNCAGGLVGSLRDDSRVVNCFSYADVSSTGYAAGIVGNNTYASTAEVENVSGVDKYTHLRTMVVNCMFYGDITGGSSRYPVYGGAKIANNTATGINNYDFYRAEASLGTLTDYNCSWPALEEYLTRYEFHRNLLNSNRELCGWWVGATSPPSTMATAAVQYVAKDASLMSKWVLDPSVAPYPILKPFGKYTSPINIDADADWRENANTWEGKKLGTLNVSVNPGSQHTASNVPLTLTITDMDTLHGDYCYRKVQLPYYNTVFGNPNGATWAEKYGDNYGDYVVIGWKVSTTEGTAGTLTENWETGYNFADRNCTAKDANRVFAQGGYYYVPNGVKNITITAQWAQAVYFDNTDHSYDRVYMSGSKPGTHFAPAGTRPATLGNGKTVLTDNVRLLAQNAAYIGDNVYDYAVVLVGNHQYRHHEGNDGENIGGTSSTKGFTVISADFDFDEEPDHCLIWQLGKKYGRQSFCPIRFDFLPVVEIGLAMKEDGSTQYYSLGCYRPLGHFEVTETSLIRFGQFEFSNKSRTVYAPLILNGGIYEQYTKGHQNYAFQVADDKIDYVIIGGNVYMPSFTPGAHVNTNAKFPTRHCAVNIIGGTIDNVYLTGNYNDEVTPNADNPHCYIDGGRIKQVAAAGKEGINGDVYFKINHSKIWEFYGGSTLADKRVTGSIDVTIDSSIVAKYCGGPKFGDMYHENGKTITTRATGTTFTFYYGGGNGGTSYVQYEKTDVTIALGAGYNWNGTGNNQGHLNNYIAGRYRSSANNYMANYDMEIVNVSTGTEAGEAVFRTYFYAAQFSATNTGTITNTLTGCKVLKNFYGAGNLGGVYGDVTSELIDTEVDSLAFGAGFSASIPQVTIYNKDKTPPTIDINTGIITPQSVGTSTTYTWCYKNPSTGVVVPKGVTIPSGVGTGNPAFVNTSDGKNYFYTTVSLENLGTVRGNVKLTLKGNSKVGTEGHADTGNVFGGGNESAVAKNSSDEKGNTTVILKEGARVLGNVYGGGNEGAVGGDSEVLIKDN